jgi:hypothetical protein
VPCVSNPHSPARREGAYGGVSWVTLFLVLGLSSATYLAWVFGPPYVLHYEVTQVARNFANRAVKERNDDELVREMVGRIRSLDQTEEVDEAGRVQKVPTVDLQVQDVLWERSSNPPTLHVSFEYLRALELPLLKRTLERTYRVDFREDISLPNWGNR